MLRPSTLPDQAKACAPAPTPGAHEIPSWLVHGRAYMQGSGFLIQPCQNSGGAGAQQRAARGGAGGRVLRGGLCKEALGCGAPGPDRLGAATRALLARSARSCDGWRAEVRRPHELAAPLGRAQMRGAARSAGGRWGQTTPAGRRQPSARSVLTRQRMPAAHWRPCMGPRGLLFAARVSLSLPAVPGTLPTGRRGMWTRAP